MKVYLLTSGEYEDYQVHGAFASSIDAKRAKFLWGLSEDESAQVEELEILTIPDLPKLDEGLKPFTVSIHVPSEYPVYVDRGWCDWTSVEEGYTFEEENQKYKFYLFAIDSEDAKKKAKERLLSL